MSHRILSSAAARLNASASTAAVAAATPVAPAAPAAAAPGAEGEAVIDVVAVTDAQAAVAQSYQDGIAAERTRTAAVFASTEGQANMGMAAWMLENNPTAEAPAICAALGKMPAAAVAPAPAPVAEAAPAAAAPAAAITTPLVNTPKIEVGVDANAAEPGDVDAAKIWDTAIAGATVASLGSSAPEIAPGIPRTGN